MSIFPTAKGGPSGSPLLVGGRSRIEWNEMGEFLFVYGTLLPDLAPPGVSDLVRELGVVGEAEIDGALYDLGHYPGLVTGAAAAGGIVKGLVVEIPNAELLGQLDDYEQFDPAQPDASLFVRERCDARLSAGGRRPCWAYVYRRDVSGAKRIKSGDYRARS